MSSEINVMFPIDRYKMNPNSISLIQLCSRIKLFSQRNVTRSRKYGIFWSRSHHARSAKASGESTTNKSAATPTESISYTPRTHEEKTSY